MNNLLSPVFDTKYELPPFEQIEESDFIPAIDAALAQARAEVAAIKSEEAQPSFENTIIALEQSGEMLGRNASILFNLNSAETTDGLQKIAQEVSPLLSAFGNEIKQDSELFARVKKVYDERDNLDLNHEELKLLEDTYIGFIRMGAELEGESQARFKEVSIELSKLSLQFSENVLAATNAYELILENENDLSGLPANLKEHAAELAKQKGKEGKWIFTLQAPSYVPFMQYADNRELREKMYRAYMSKCLFEENDNKSIILKIIQLRSELASILGYQTYAEYVLERRMAASHENVMTFLEDLLAKSLPKAKEEVEELKQFMEKMGVSHELERWDWAYYSEKLRKEKYAIDDELIKPYFQIEQVINGAFTTAEKLYNIQFIEDKTFPKYHEEVKTYEVKDSDSGEVIAVFMTDFFPRKGKRGGAWMTSYRSQGKKNGENIIPQVSIVCNFSPSTENSPSLLKFDEVRTLFHEFGHALHGILANTTYQSLSGTSVYWDFVELPSQIMENWCLEKECLDLFAKHYETGELIPSELVEKIKHSSTFHEAYATVRQVSFATLDMSWHSLSKDTAQATSDVVSFEREIFKKMDLFPEVADTNMSVQFSHIFAGGYGAGYYSYKWAEVLDADAFEIFLENGIFDSATAKRFRENILSQGGTTHPMELYERFAGRKPKVDALLKRAGLG